MYFLVATVKMKIRGVKSYIYDISEVADVLLCLLGFAVFAIVLKLRDFEEARGDNT